MKTLQRVASFIAFCFLCIQAQSQITGSKAFIHLPYDYNFYLENYSLSFPVPANWGFQVPYLNTKDASLTISSNVRYSVSLDSISKSSSILFALPDNQKACLELRMTAYGADQIDNSTITSDFGNFHKIDQLEEEKVESYQNITENKVLTFRILSKDEKEKQACRDLIAACKTEYGYSDEYSQYSRNNHSIQYYAKDSTYYPSLGFTFVIPFDASAEIWAPKIKINEATTLLAAYGTLDEFSEEGTVGTFWTKDFSMKYSFTKNDNPEFVENLISSFSETYKEECHRSFSYPIDGIPSTIHVFGSPSMPTIVAIIPSKNYSAVFTFADVTTERMDDISTIISQIHFDDAQKEGLALVGNYEQSLGEFVNIKPISYASLNLKEVNLEKNASIKNVKTVECTIVDMSATIAVPYLDNVQVYPSGDEDSGVKEKKGKYEVTLKKDPESDIASQMDFYAGLVTSSSNGDYCILWMPANEDKLTAEQYFSKAYTPFECHVENSVKRAGTCTIKGQKWYVLSAEVEYYVIDYFITEHKGELLEIRIVRQNSDSSSGNDLTKTMETLLYKATFK